MTTIRSTADIGKSMSVRCEKHDDEEVVNARVAFSGLFVDRDQMDYLLRRPHGWSQFLFDEQGAPVARLCLQLLTREWTGSATLRGNKPNEYAAINEMVIRNASLTLCTNGASLDAHICWDSARSSVEDINDFLGRMVNLSLVIDDEVQLDLLTAAVRREVAKDAA